MPADNPLIGEQSLPGEQAPGAPELVSEASSPNSMRLAPEEAVAAPAPAPDAVTSGEEVLATFPVEPEPSPWMASVEQAAALAAEELPGAAEGEASSEAEGTASAPTTESGTLEPVGVEPSASAAPAVEAPSVQAPAVAARELPPALRLIAAFGRPSASPEASGEEPLSEDEAEGRVAEAGLRQRAQVAPALIALDRLDEEDTFQVRPPGDVSLLATDIARVGQLFPVDVRVQGPDRFQVVCGFRRVAALRFLHREFVLARVHTDLGDEDALLMALAAAIHATPVGAGELAEVRDRLAGEGRLFAAARDMLDKALQPDDDLAPESVEEEVDADELAGDVAQRLGAINQDLSLLADVFQSLDESRRAELLMQLRYSAELVAFLEGQS